MERPPSLAALYARALVTAPGRDGDTLPERVLELAPQRVDPAHLAEYSRVCGLRLGDVLPPTYPHVLSFALQVALMTERDFPFPLVGLVHVANAITVRSPLRRADRPAFTVRAANLGSHPAGRQFDVFTEASVDGEPVWQERSTYLRRGASPPRPSGRTRPPSPPQQGPVARLAVPAGIGRRYAAVSGDRNPIHLSRVSARLFGFPRAIAHGMWLKARVLATLEGRLPDACTVDVRFRAPLLLPSSVLVASPRENSEWTLDVRSARSGRPHLSGTAA